MAVFTKISDKEFSQILKTYDIGSFVRSEEISEGVENTNYRIFTDKDKFIFTVYEKRVNIEDLPFFLNLQDSLFKNGFKCPQPISNNEGNVINLYGEKSYTIVSHIKGKWSKTLKNNIVEEAGKVLGDMHKKTGKLDGLSRNNSMGKDFWLETYEKCQIQAEEYYPELNAIYKMAKNNIENGWDNKLPKGIIHADYFPDNVMFFENKVSGVIDFYMACVDLYIYDLAIALNAWCFEKDHSFNITKAKIFLNSYNKSRELSEQELEKLPTICVGASLRFLSTRLYDYFNQDADVLVTPKDPREYIEKLKFHLQVSSFSDYGI